MSVIRRMKQGKETSVRENNKQGMKRSYAASDWKSGERVREETVKCTEDTEFKSVLET